MKPVAAGLALLALLVACSTSPDDATPSTSSDTGRATTAPATSVWESRALPSYDWSRKPSPVVVRTAERDIRLKAWSGCWNFPSGKKDRHGGICFRGGPAPRAKLPSAGSPEAIDFWFGMPDYRFQATLTEIDVRCPRSEDAKVVPTGDHTFRIDPVGLSGRYRVDLHAKGAPAGSASYSFLWETPADGPLDEPSGYVGWVSGHRKPGDLWSYGVEVGVDDLGFHPRTGHAKVTATAANGRSITVEIPLTRPSLRPCSRLGGFYFQTDDPATQAVVDLGPAPFSYRVEMTLDGTRYVGTSTWPDDLIRGLHPYTRLTWKPPLPAYDGRR